MKAHCLRSMVGIFILIFISNITFAIEKDGVEIVRKKVTVGYIKKIAVKIDGTVQEIKLPFSGAREKSFSFNILHWGNSRILALTLDDRGQISSVAYYEISNKNYCFIGEHSALNFDEDSNFVVEPMHSSASEQVINRYKLKKCELSFYDQLIDKALDTDDVNVFKRQVVRVKGNNLPSYKCEYEINQGKVVDEKNCFKQ